MPEQDGANADGNGLVPADSTKFIRDAYEEQQRRKQAFLAESSERRALYERKLEELHSARQEAMAQASNYAGNLGLIYRADTNTFFRVVIVDDQNKLGPRPTFPALLGTTTSDSHVAVNEETDQTSNRATPETLEVTEQELPGVEEGTIKAPTKTSPEHEPPRPPQPPERPSPPVPSNPDKKWESSTNIKSGIAWLGSIFVGWFVGFGLLSLTGLPYERDEDKANLYLFTAIGIATVGVFKLVFDTMWYSLGRRQILGATDWKTPLLLTFLSTVLVAVEAGLGGQALVTYSARSSFQAEGTLPFGLAFLLATAITTPTVIYSGLVGYQKGQRSITQSDIDQRIHELKMRDYEEARQLQTRLFEHQMESWKATQDREQELLELAHNTEKERIKDIQSAHAEALESYRESSLKAHESHELGVNERLSRLEEYESFRNLPDFQALCKFIGLIETINLRIREVKQDMINDSISRGHGKRSIL